MHINVLNMLSNIQINLISLPHIIYIPNRGDVGEITCSVNLACITYYIYAYHDFGEKLRCS